MHLIYQIIFSYFPFCSCDFCQSIVVLQGSRLSCGTRALTLTAVRTSGVISVSLRFTRLDGALLVANLLYLQKVSLKSNFLSR